MDAVNPVAFFQQQEQRLEKYNIDISSAIYSIWDPWKKARS